jgi:hypothetical protein
MAPNPWLEHVKKVRAKNKNMPYKEVLKKAKETYKKKAPASSSKTTKKAPKSSKKDMPAEE